MRLARLVETLGGIPDARRSWLATAPWSRRRIRYTDVTTTAATSTVATVTVAATRYRARRRAGPGPRAGAAQLVRASLRVTHGRAHRLPPGTGPAPVTEHTGPLEGYAATALRMMMRLTILSLLTVK